MLLVFGASCQHSLLAGREHGRTIPLAEMHSPRKVVIRAQSPSGIAWITGVSARPDNVRLITRRVQALSVFSAGPVSVGLGLVELSMAPPQAEHSMH